MTDLVLVPGLNCTAALFAPQIEGLADVATCHVADHASADRLEGIAAAILDAAPDRFALAGLSMGGYVAFEIIRQAPERVMRLCLLDTRAAMDGLDDAERRRQTIMLAGSGRFSALHAVFWPRLVHPSRAGDAALERIVRTMMDDTGPERFIRQQSAILHRRDYAPVLDAIAVPTRIVVGAQDAITPPDASREMQHRIAGSSLVEIADCGHLSTLERPNAVTQAMREWLKA
jgi:pimeloyl-ACP methyl ester carboxylesterase